MAKRGGEGTMVQKPTQQPQPGGQGPHRQWQVMLIVHTLDLMYFASAVFLLETLTPVQS